MAEFNEIDSENRIIQRALQFATEDITVEKRKIYNGDHPLPFDVLDTMAAAIRFMHRRLHESSKSFAFAVGDRVCWLGGADFGRYEVAWVGIVTKIGLGLPSAYDDQGRELLPRDPAAEVEPIYPQHGVKERLVHQNPCIVKLKDLRHI